ncbi:hypothetical protein SAMD00024442_7_53 [Candidatus Symbiothrix dinenymphae]|nr:hypothetical protein SAMD00024442_7_53 [Candidatus Symbiothrix dinenymphae]
MEVEYKEAALADLDFWRKSGNTKVQAKITALIDDICEHPFIGIGKPEPLKYELAGLWSRRITRGHRLIYEIYNGKLFIISMKGHYD